MSENVSLVLCLMIEFYNNLIAAALLLFTFMSSDVTTIPHPITIIDNII